MSRVCAYCNVEGSMTKEHIWSKALIERWDSELRAYNPKTRKVYTGEPVIKDVCAKCNNVRLSQLDQYLVEVYDSQMKDHIKAGSAVVFRYSYDLLLRSLLKISFNSCRATGDDKKAIIAHQKARSYILGESKRPKGFTIRLQIVTPSKGMNEKGEIIYADFSHDAMRCAKILFTGSQTDKFQIRLVAIKSFWFYLIIPMGRHTKKEKSSFIEEFKKWKIQPGVAIQSTRSEVIIPVEKTTYMHPLLLGTLLLANS